MRVEIKTPYLLFLGDEPDITHAKTAVGISHWRPDACIGQYRLSGSGVDLGFPDITPAEAAAAAQGPAQEPGRSPSPPSW